MNALYDELTAAIVAGGLTPNATDLTQLAKSFGNQFRSKRLFDVSGISDVIILTTPEGMPPVTELKAMDEFSFLVGATNVTPTVTIQIDGLAPLPLSSVVASHQIFASALLTVRYLSGAFYITNQINPKTGNEVSLIGRLMVDTTNLVRAGEVIFDGAELSRTEYPILWAIASATRNLIEQTSKNADLQSYAGYYGTGDGETTFTLPTLGGEFIRGYDNGRGVDAGRVFGSYQKESVRLGYPIRSQGNGFSKDGHENNVGTFIPVTDDAIGTSTLLADPLETRPRSIAYFFKTLV